MPKLTKSLVEKAELREKRYLIFDEQLPGFCLCVSPNGRRFYYLQYMKNKRVKRMTIGMHGILTTEEARDQAIKLLAEVKSGGDPQRVAQEKRQEPYMDELCERYMDEHVAIHCKPRTQAGYAWLMKKFIKPYFRDMKVSEVTRADVAAFHHKM
jgi:hypothetical protein